VKYFHLISNYPDIIYNDEIDNNVDKKALYYVLYMYKCKDWLASRTGWLAGWLAGLMDD